MQVFWAFLAVVVVIVFLFVIMPALLPVAPIHPITIQDLVPEERVAPSPTQAELARSELDKQFQESQAKEVTEDYPLKKIGACPFSKPPSTDLPIPDIPMCSILKNEGGLVDQGMRLHLPTAPKPCPVAA